MKKRLRCMQIKSNNMKQQNKPFHFVSGSVWQTDEPKETANGLRLTARLKVWDKANYNHFIFTPSCYDKFINEYYEQNGMYLPLTLMHGKTFADICGRVESLSKDEDGMTAEVTILKEYPQFDWLKSLIDNHIIQGMSDEGIITDGEYTETGNFVASEVFIQAISLVTNPAEARAGIETQNTIFRGFGADDTKANYGALSFLKK